MSDITLVTKIYRRRGGCGHAGAGEEKQAQMLQPSHEQASPPSQQQVNRWEIVCRASCKIAMLSTVRTQPGDLGGVHGLSLSKSACDLMHLLKDPEPSSLKLVEDQDRRTC